MGKVPQDDDTTDFFPDSKSSIPVLSNEVSFVSSFILIDD